MTWAGSFRRPDQLDLPLSFEGARDAGATLDQVKAARVTADYDSRYGAASGAWTTSMFVEAVYRDLSKRK